MAADGELDRNDVAAPGLWRGPSPPGPTRLQKQGVTRDVWTMKSAVFARPNLKIFLMAAILLVVVQHVITSSQGESGVLPANARDITDSQLQQLIRQAVENPGVQIYMRISNCYERRGDYKRALQYLRRAEKIGQTEPE
jgi:hypothetical protein